MKTIVTLAAVAALSMTAGASAFAADETPAASKPAPAKRSCFFASQINGWGADPDEKTAYLYVSVKDVYRAELFSRCDGLDSAIGIGVETRGGSSICDDMDLELIVRSPIGPQRCVVTKLTKLTPEEVAARKGKKKSR